MAIITREQGGSVLNIASTGHLRVESGASITLSGSILGNLNLGDAASAQFKPNATANNTVYQFLKIGNNSWYYSAGSGGSPQFSGSPGDICWVANSASTNLWVNVSNGTTGSKWAAMRLTVAGSQVQSAV